jgi:hypothetical protein
MRIQLLSDLHLERQPTFQPTLAAADVLVLAGDIGSYQNGSQLSDDDFGLTRFSPLQPDAPWRHVLFTPGNHEFDGLDFDATYARLKTLCAQLGIVWLEREQQVIDGVRFVGTTLWSDFDALAVKEPTATRQLQQRQKAFRAANYYLKKNSSLRCGTPMLAESLRELALECQEWLRNALTQAFDGHTVVVTHFAPSLRSADPRYGVVPGSAGFCNSLEDLLPHASLWLHGHLHCPVNYRVQGENAGRYFDCQVRANPLGYAHKNEQLGFQPDCVITLSEYATEAVRLRQARPE